MEHVKLVLYAYSLITLMLEDMLMQVQHRLIAQHVLSSMQS